MVQIRSCWLPAATVAGLLLFSACNGDSTTETSALKAQGIAADAARGGRAAVPGLEKVKHVVVIYLENHSFDNLYGEFPGADGLGNASTTITQRDLQGHAYATLPAIPGGQFPANLANAPFNIDQYVASNLDTPDLVHRFYQEQAQIHGGAMDRFAAISDARGLVMGYYHTAGLPLAEEAARYTLCDRFFHAAFGGSFLNHMWLIAARSPAWTGSPGAIGTSGTQLAPSALNPDGSVTDGQVAIVDDVPYLVNTVYSVNKPALNFSYSRPRVPNLTDPTIGDRLSERGISWAWYAGGWNDAMAGHADPLFQFHHQPFVYFANYADGTQAKADHLRDESEFVAAARAGSLPAVSFVKPLGEVNEHPGYTDVLAGEQHVEQLIEAVRNGPDWNSSVIVITYDENGGFWDHVPPPTVDAWGPGTRVPTLVISPFAKRGVVDHTYYDTTSILALIEHRWGLEPLSTRDAAAADLTNTLDLSQARRE
jgi:phospholipase C